jgi:hypothetical protein
MTQKFCKHCGGIKKIMVNGELLPYDQWIKHGIAIDAGCVCLTNIKPKKI